MFLINLSKKNFLIILLIIFLFIAEAKEPFIIQGFSARFIMLLAGIAYVFSDKNNTHNAVARSIKKVGVIN